MPENPSLTVDLTGQAGKFVKIKDDETGYEFVASAPGEGVSLGETDTTAYRGDRGKTAYDHSQAAHAPSNAQKNSDITKAEIEAKLTGAITTHTHDYAATGHNHDGTYAPALGADDNYVTDAEKTKLANLSGTNTGDQNLSTLATKATTITINGTTQDLSANRTWTVTADPYVARLVQAGNVATGANVTPVNLTGMSFAYVAGGIYRVDIYGTVQAGAATTGHGFGVNCTTAPVLVSLSGGTILANTGTGTCWSAIANNAIVGVTSGLPSTNTNVMSLGGGILVMNASTGGTCQFIFRSETTAVTTCMANTVILITKVN